MGVGGGLLYIEHFLFEYIDHPSYAHNNWPHLCVNHHHSFGSYALTTFCFQYIDHRHNGDWVFQSNYESGLRILHFDTELGELTEYGYFDVYPFITTANFAGTWSNYPYLRNDELILSFIGTKYNDYHWKHMAQWLGRLTQKKIWRHISTRNKGQWLSKETRGSVVRASDSRQKDLTSHFYYLS